MYDQISNQTVARNRLQAIFPQHTHNTIITYTTLLTFTLHHQYSVQCLDEMLQMMICRAISDNVLKLNYVEVQHLINIVSIVVSKAFSATNTACTCHPSMRWSLKTECFIKSAHTQALSRKNHKMCGKIVYIL